MVSGVLIYILVGSPSLRKDSTRSDACGKYSAVAIKRGASRRWSVSTNVHSYFINLLVFDLIQAIGGIIDVKWVAIGNVTEGSLCTAQAIFKQIGDVGVALSNVVGTDLLNSAAQGFSPIYTPKMIALHTFCVLVLRWNAPTRMAPFPLALIWTFIALIVGVSYATHKSRDFYGNTQYWCWITASYDIERIALEYFWMWAAALINLLCYGIMALVVKGALVVDGMRFRFIGWKSQKGHSLEMGDSANLTGADRIQSNAIARHMLFYPLIYILAVSPITIVRWMAFSGTNVPFPATAFASVVFSLSGVFNVILFAMTRPKLLPHREPRARIRPFSFPAGTHPSLRYTPANNPIEATHASWESTLKAVPSELPVLHIGRDQFSVSR
ncbi:hypothetical protein D9757_005381 [Collybiopsis confluens]|uniref:Glucose receptor Git3 N-terminal domain-containing protein n=1 Tax=Collybiopsis confluens TaxID=2823264 RepID=A0A8H5M994_9AGAR|nr:hypothetical protein D9757_005381 [Collybiopsis confluens]